MAEVKSNLIELEVVYSKLNKALDENINRLNIGATAVENYNKKISVIPSEFQKSLVDIKTKTDAVTISSKKLEQQSIKESNARNALNKQREQAIAQIDKENAKLQASENLYNKVQSKLNSLSNEYKNLAARKELGLSLTAKEEQRYISLQGRIQTYDKTLKAVDATMGKHQRNVGNYASGFNPLSNSINQLTREMPAFTYSVQTGFMALSNNIPIFTDAIGNAVRANKELIAQGQPTTSVFKQLLSSLFSFQTLLGVGITLLTVYGKEIGIWVSELWGASEALDELNKAQKEFNSAKLDGRKESIKDIKTLNEYVAVMRNSNLSMRERKIALDAIRASSGGYFKALSDQQMLEGNIRKELGAYKIALQDVQILEKQRETTINASKKVLDLKEQLRLNELLINSNKKELEERKKITLSDNFEVAKEQRRLLTLASDKYNSSIAKRLSLEQTIAKYNEFIRTSTNEEIDLKGKVIILEEKANDNANKRIANKKKEKDLDEQLLFGTEAWLTAQISALTETRSKTAKSSDAYREIGGAIAYYQKWLETLTGAQKKHNEETDKTLKYGTIEYYEALQNELKALQKTQVDNNEEFSKYQKQIDFYQTLINAITGAKDATKELEKANTDYYDSFVDSFSSESGFSKTFDILRGNIKDFGKDATTTALAVSEAFQEAFNTISESSQANFDREYERLSLQKDVALQFAGESSTAKEEIERQYEEKRKAIARRQAESEKRLAIFNIGINTAQAIIATLAKTPPPVGLPLAIAVGAIGAAQIAMVSAQEIPQFWRGTENAPEGWALTQEKGAEVITDKYGKVKSYGNNKGAQMTYLNRGDKVYNAQKSEAYINKELAKNGIMPMRQSIINNNENNSLSKDDFNNGISKLAKTFKSQQPSSNTQVFLNNKQINTDYFKGQKV